jgi:hypothetical protein
MPPFRMPPNDMEAIAIHGYPTVPAPPADGEARRGGLLGSILPSRRRGRQA